MKTRKTRPARRERCGICYELPEPGEGRYMCMKCNRIVCSSCSYNAGKHGLEVMCGDCVQELSPSDLKTWKVLRES
jgi:transcription elongation factor Elf1